MFFIQKMARTSKKLGGRQPLRVCVVGSGTRFLSGISYYTLLLSNSLSTDFNVSTILMRQLLPACFYPGRERVGAKLTGQNYRPEVHVFDGVDWYWLPSMVRAIKFLLKEKPDILIFQWWTGTVLHTYLLLALLARLSGAKIIIEFHEVLDTGEARLGPVKTYVAWFLPLLIHMASGFVAHSDFDRQALQEHFNLGIKPVSIIPHGPYNQYKAAFPIKPLRKAPLECCNYLFFGVIRPYKGLEDLITAFDSIPDHEIENYWLTIVGETWEGWNLPALLLETSRYRHRITFVNRYVCDEEVSAVFAGADVIVLPYHRSSASGPMHIAMAMGLPVITTKVGGLLEAGRDYQGIIFVPPKDPEQLRCALEKGLALRGRNFQKPYEWHQTVDRMKSLISVLKKNH